MRTLALLVWLTIPVLVGAYHYGPGQEQVRLDEAAQALASAEKHAASENWGPAANAYERALALLPVDRPAEARRIRLERDKAWMLDRKLPEAADDLDALIDEMQADPKADPAVLAGAREAMANAQYYLTWLIRLEGLGREVWEPEIEGARQTYRLLAEQARAASDDEAAARHEADLESAIRLARMEPGDLQGLALPKQCQGCKSGQCKGRKPSRNSSTGKDGRGASSGPPPDGAGS